MRRPEVLAPAGDEASMRAAVRAGADAVYFGLQGFNARARARNFDAASLADTLARLHEHGCKGYVTLNTLVFDHELDGAKAAIEACARAGVDAVIVQDLAVAGLVRAMAPDLPIHASTQMTCTDAGSVLFARELGARRVVLARELSIEQIDEIATATRGQIELEVFVHGALCVSYSGQCLTSEAIGGRSANRGACAQACRLPYELVVDGVVRELGDKAYLLSPMDLEAVTLVPRLAELGVASLKIEGRLKGPEYVFATTRLYREASYAAVGQSAPPSDEHRRLALQTYSRGSGEGFLLGVDHQRLVEGASCDHRGVPIGACTGTTHAKGGACVGLTLETSLGRGDGILVLGGFGGEGEVGGRVWELYDERGQRLEQASAGQRVSAWLGPDKPIGALVAGRRVFRTADPRASEAISRDLEREPVRAPLDLRVTGAIGEPLTVTATSARDGRVAVARTDVPIDRARNAATDRAVLEDKLGRLGDTPFVLSSLELNLPSDAFVPVGALNRVRRELTEALAAGARREHAIRSDAAVPHAPPDRAPPPGGLFVLCRSIEQARAAVAAGADGVVLDFLELVGTGAALRALREETKVPITLTPPRVRKPGEEKIDRFLESLAPDALLVRGLGALREGSALPRVGDFSLNVTNSVSAAAVLARGLLAFTPSFDLDAEQLEGLLSYGFGPFAEVVVHHPMPLFHNEHCLFAALLSEGRDHKTCGRPCDTHTVALRDRAGMDHPVIADVGCRNTVFHARSQSAATLIPMLRHAGVTRFRIELVRESAADVERLVRVYRSLTNGDGDPEQAWRELRTDGGYGVVRGSLRVLA